MTFFDTRMGVHAGTSPPQWAAQDYAIDADFMPLQGSASVRLLDARAGERILDLGCGDGVLATELALSGARITGVDIAPELVGAARARGIDAQVMDAQALGFDGDFDAVFSQAALHWMPHADRVLAGVHRALRPGGRFVAELAGQGHLAAIIAAVQAARLAQGHAASAFRWYLPSAEAYADRLHRHGFQVQLIECTPQPTAMPAGAAAWLRVFASPLLDDLPAAARTTVRDAAATLLAELPRDAHGQPLADRVRLRVLARRH